MPAARMCKEFRFQYFSESLRANRVDHVVSQGPNYKNGTLRSSLEPKLKPGNELATKIRRRNRARPSDLSPALGLLNPRLTRESRSKLERRKLPLFNRLRQYQTDESFDAPGTQTFPGSSDAGNAAIDQNQSRDLVRIAIRPIERDHPSERNRDHSDWQIRRFSLLPSSAETFNDRGNMERCRALALGTGPRKIQAETPLAVSLKQFRKTIPMRAFTPPSSQQEPLHDFLVSGRSRFGVDPRFPGGREITEACLLRHSVEAVARLDNDR
jgi:hypothetical protein